MTRELLDALTPPAESAESVPGQGPDAGEAEAAAPVRESEAQTGADTAPRPPLGDRSPRREETETEDGPDPAIAAHLEALVARGEALRREFPDFDLSAALRDADFVRLTAPGVGIDPRRAWLALHPEILERRAAADSAAALARSLASGALRPREGGGQTGAPPAADYRSLPRSEQKRVLDRIRRAAARGEKLYP